ncbi:30S ribosomal protein S3 [Candidatus Saganbacteria bacterium]|nr:30S ribosomal protein S3 [Candidatus Saganbacteria bacterium]
MGQKIHPRGLRLGIIENGDALWFAGKFEYSKLLKEDIKIRKFLKDHLFKAGIARIIISRRANQIEVDIFSARPGLIIGRGGRDVTVVRDALAKLTGKQVQLNIREEQNAEANAQLVSENIAAQLEKRVAHRRAIKQSVSRVLRARAKGIKVRVAGRLGGSEIARKESYRVGRVPLHTLRAIIDYGTTEAMTIYGKIGVKVWIYKGDMLRKKENKAEGQISGAATS